MPSHSEPATQQAHQLAAAVGAQLYPASVISRDGALFCLLRQGQEKHLAIFSPGERLPVGGFHGEPQGTLSGGWRYWRCPRDATNARALRGAFPWLAPQRLGVARSVGCGDRLGLATPGHVRSVAKTFLDPDTGQERPGMRPIFAQQSIRENSRTGRTPQEVLDDAMWGVFQAGWRRGYGADADHLKSREDVDATLAAGYTFFTVDPGEHVDGQADHLRGAALQERLEALPWDLLEDSLADLRRRYLGHTFHLGSLALTFDPESLAVAAVKYGRAVAHTAALYRHLLAQAGPEGFELEMSVDETETPTRHLEHLYIATELKRLGVRWVSLAPRFVGRFEKGVDYMGDDGRTSPEALARFRQDLAGHVAIAQALGPYKLSLHSGSDKFSIYPIVAQEAGSLVHLKTAGTSYLEALRAVAQVAPELFRAIYAFARERYPEDRATYHVSAQVARMPDPATIPDGELPGVLDQFDARQALHVTFGSVLNARGPDGSLRFKPALLAILDRHEEEHYAALERHFDRHLGSFVG